MATPTATDNAVSAAALKRARAEGLSLATVKRLLLAQYAAGKFRITLSQVESPDEEFTAADAAAYARARADLDAGKNVSDGWTVLNRLLAKK